MADTKNAAPLPDLANGFPLASIPDGGSVAGKLGKAEVLLIRRGDRVDAIGARCTHYRGRLADGLIVGETIRCPLHHACFSIRTGEALRAPALDPIACYRIERVGELVHVREKIEQPAGKTPAVIPGSIVIIGGGGAGLAAAEMLRREGYAGTLTMISADSAGPVDRPNLSKDFLAGSAQEDWIPLQAEDWYRDQRIDLILNARVTKLDPARKQVALEDGRTFAFDAALLATGAEPVRLDVAGAAPGQIHYLRTFADSQALIARASSAKRALVIGASFIGLEVAASLRARGLDVHVVAPERQPLERVMGPDVGAFIRAVHESQGVRFHLGTTVKHLDDGRKATLENGETIDADLVVAGVGVRPSVALAESAGLTVDRGVVLNEYLETSAPGIYAAGDIARWPDPHTGDRIRVEHWVVAERLGQIAARNMLGGRERCDLVPFFWSQHFDVTIRYTGHAEKWTDIRIDGSLNAGTNANCAVRYMRDGKLLAVATIERDLENLKAEAAMESVNHGGTEGVGGTEKSF